MKTWNNFVLEEDENDLEENAFLKVSSWTVFSCAYCGLYHYNMRAFFRTHMIFFIFVEILLTTLA